MLHVFPTDRAVNHCRIQFYMSQKFLYLFYRHSFVKYVCCHCAAEPMRVNLFNPCLSAQFPQYFLYPRNGKPFVWRFQAYK